MFRDLLNHISVGHLLIPIIGSHLLNHISAGDQLFQLIAYPQSLQALFCIVLKRCLTMDQTQQQLLYDSRGTHT